MALNLGFVLIARIPLIDVTLIRISTLNQYFNDMLWHNNHATFTNVAEAGLINLHSGIASPPAPCNFDTAVGPTDGSSSKGSEFALI